MLNEHLFITLYQFIPWLGSRQDMEGTVPDEVEVVARSAAEGFLAEFFRQPPRMYDGIVVWTGPGRSCPAACFVCWNACLTFEYSRHPRRWGLELFRLEQFPYRRGSRVSALLGSTQPCRLCSRARARGKHLFPENRRNVHSLASRHPALRPLIGL